MEKQGSHQSFKLGSGILSISHLLSSKECKKLLSEHESKCKPFFIHSFRDEELSNRIFENCKTIIRKFIGPSDEVVKFHPVSIDPNFEMYKNDLFFSKKCKNMNLMTICVKLSRKEMENEDIVVYSGMDRIVVNSLDRGDALVVVKNKFLLENNSGQIVGKYLVSSILFERNDEYEKILEKLYNRREEKMNDECDDDGSIVLKIGENSYEISIKQIRKFPESILSVLISTPLIGDVTYSENGLRVFSFPNQNSSIFQDYVLPIIEEAPYLDIPIDLNKESQLEISNEFKFWGFLSPYDSDSISKDVKYSNREYPCKSPEISLISNALSSHLLTEKQNIEAKLSILSAFPSIQAKIRHDFSYKPFEESMGKLDFRKCIEIEKQIEKNLNFKYECIPMNSCYDNNFFLIGSDRELFEICCSLFGIGSISLSHLSFMVDHQSSNINIASTNQSSQVEYVDIHQLGTIIRMAMRKYKTPQEVEDSLSGCGIILPSSLIENTARFEKFWKGSGTENDEYFPDYSLFKLSVILIDIKSLQ